MIFETHPDDARDGTLDFTEPLEHHASRHRLARNREIAAYTADRAKLVSARSEKRAQRHADLAGAANQVRSNLRQFTGQRQTFFAL